MDDINKKPWLLLGVLLCFIAAGGLAERCGRQAGGALCPDGLCCSQFGWCGSTFDYCNSGTCQIQCRGAPPPAGGLSDTVSRDTFNQMLMHRDDSACQARGFYTYDAFIEAAKSFPAFGSTGDVETRKREIAAFLGQTSHETSGGWPTAPDGPYAWGYCFNKEPQPSSSFCDMSSRQFPCVPGRQYYGRGPFQISWNFNYGPCGKAIGVDLLNSPDLVATDAVISFKTALWFWMTAPGWTKSPSCHDVMTGIWTPSAADRAAGRLPGYGATTNIIKGGLECGRGKKDPRVEDRIGFYKRYCDLLAMGYSSNLDCYSMKPFGSSSSLLHAPI